MNAYIIGGYRTAVCKAKKGNFRFTRPDDLAVEVLKKLLSDFPQLDKTTIDDVMIGNAFPEAEQGFNMGRIVSMLGLDNVHVPGATVNRYCASGIETIAIAAAKIHSGMADIIIAGGAESMSMIPFGGWRIVPNIKIAKENPSWYWGMGLTAEKVANDFNISREAQDLFALNSHNKALAAINNRIFSSEIVPIEITENYFADEEVKTKKIIVDTDEGPRATTIEQMLKLKAVFAEGGSVTAGNSSQTSDGAALTLIVSEKMLNILNVKPLARLLSYQVAGIEPNIMGVGPVKAIPKALQKAGLKLHDIEQIELNEAFAAQSIAVIEQLGLNPEIININGGAIALGHPLGATGTKLTVQLLNEMRRRKLKFGMVSMCIGTGQGAAAIFEVIY